MLRLAKQFGPPVLTLAILAFIVGFARLDIERHGVNEFMQRSRQAIFAVPRTIGDWKGEDRPIDARARKLLNPNAELSVVYSNSRTRAQAMYSVIQTTDARHMTGHAPRNCYVGNGWQIVSETPRTWKAGGLDVKGIEYRMERPEGLSTRRWNLRSFYIFPDGHYGATLEELDRAAEDYRKLAFGVAQVQLITSDQMNEKQRDEAFEQLVGSERSLEMIRVLRSGISR